MRRLLAFIIILISVVASSAEALTSREVLELSRAGLGEEVLLALIEADGGVFTLDPATLANLKQAGVSERVILAMVRSGRMRSVQQTDASDPATELSLQPLPLQPQPQVIVIEHETPVVQQVPVAVPVYVPMYPVYPRPFRRAGTHRFQQVVPFDPSPGFGAPLPPQAFPERAREKAEPVYWGWGGKLRPDAWTPRGVDRHRE